MDTTTKKREKATFSLSVEMIELLKKRRYEEGKTMSWQVENALRRLQND